MSKKTFSVGTLEEDFKKIGLIPETKDLQEGKYKPVKGGKEDSIPNKAAKTPSEAKPESGEIIKKVHVTAPKESNESQGEAAGESAGDDLAEEDAEAEPEITERIRRLRKRRLTSKTRVARRKAKVLRRKKRAKLRAKARKWRRSARGKRFLKRYHQALQRFHGHAPKGVRLSLKSGLDRVSNLIEEIEEITQASEAQDKHEEVRSFAQLALISHKLAENYGFACTATKEQEAAGNKPTEDAIDFCEYAKHFESLSERAAELAEVLNKSIAESKEHGLEEEKLKSEFASMLEDTMNGLELLSDLLEDAESDDDESSSEKDGDDEVSASEKEAEKPEDDKAAPAAEKEEAAEASDSDDDESSESSSKEMSASASLSKSASPVEKRLVKKAEKGVTGGEEVRPPKR
jgi:hypothetical protein